MMVHSFPRKIAHMGQQSNFAKKAPRPLNIFGPFLKLFFDDAFWRKWKKTNNKLRVLYYLLIFIHFKNSSKPFPFLLWKCKQNTILMLARPEKVNNGENWEASLACLLYFVALQTNWESWDKKASAWGQMSGHRDTDLEKKVCCVMREFVISHL